MNSAAIPADLAERLLFGARRGAFSGAVDSAGYFQAADGGTLFLDEIAELPLALQAKLLRAIEEREVLPLGATRPVSVDVRLCAATLRDLRRETARGTFRQDLYFRVARPAVRVPPLRERPEEIPALVERAVRSITGAGALDRPLALRPGLVEACLLRPWPGNVRELWFEVRAAAVAALSAGRSSIDADHLEEDAGQELGDETEPACDAATLREVMATERGNLSRAAERLGLPRTTLRRLLVRYGLDLATLRRGGGEG